MAVTQTQKSDTKKLARKIGLTFVCLKGGQSGGRLAVRAAASGQQHQGSSTRAASEESSQAPKLLLAITFDWSLGGRFRASFGLSRLASFGLAVLEVG